MRDFRAQKAQSLPDLRTAMQSGAVPLAGGTELVNWMRLGIATPDALVVIPHLPELCGIARQGKSLRIGSMTTLAELEASDLIRSHAPALSMACTLSASAQIRNRATLGGNLLQRTRCPYFRAQMTGAGMPWPCNKRKPGSGCAAQGGVYDRAALFGATDACIASQPSDPAVALAALDAMVEISGPEATRAVPVADFFLTQQDAGDARDETLLQADEIITALTVPLVPLNATSRYIKLRERKSYEYALVSAAVALTREGSRVMDLRIVLGSVAQKPWRLPSAEQALAGREFDGQAARDALDAAMSEAVVPPGQYVRLVLAQNAVIRAIEDMIGGDNA